MATKDRLTYSGGYQFAVRRIDRENLSLDDIRGWLWRHHDIPRSERGGHWHGVEAALSETIGRIVHEGEMDEEAAMFVADRLYANTQLGAM